MEQIPINVLSLISSRLFIIRKALVMNEKKVEIEPNLSIFLNKDLAFIGTFDYKSNKESFPSHLLDSFRTIDFYLPNIKKIIHAGFVVLGFDSIQSTEFSDKFILFLNLINESLFKCHYMINGGLSKKDFKEILSNYHKGESEVLCSSFGRAKRIIEYCKDVFLDKKTTNTEEILWKAIANYFKGILSANNLNIVANIFSNIFNYKNMQ